MALQVGKPRCNLWREMKVNIIKRDGQAALVEWESATGYKRAIVPADSITDEQCPDETLSGKLPSLSANIS